MDEVKGYLDRKTMEIFERRFIEMQGEAQDKALQTAHDLTASLLQRLANTDPALLSAMQTPSMQYAIYNAQKSAAIADDEQLTETLLDILIDKASAAPRSFKDVVLAEALDVASKLTSDQIDTLSGILMLTRTVSYGTRTLDEVIAKLVERCSPFFEKIATNSSVLQYLSYTGVGVNNGFGFTVIDKVAETYDGAFTRGFTKSELPEGLHELLGTDVIVEIGAPESDPNADNPTEPEVRYRFAIATTQYIERQFIETSPAFGHREDIAKLVGSHRLNTDEVRQILSSKCPDFLKYIDELDQLGAGSFDLSSVGVAIAQANWRRLQPSTAPDIDIYLN
ncbi:LPO_1073/Vpar_1526 family protein [Gordonia rubripertincta]|uniref:Uncharacterized protein n=1 Tax=Gordonia rubripertincta TaxID=36822 RepID=A0ABT4MSU5_GORRU|nr:LPO_1073/Vpar_1526 family protein [Gordonia rubripertincta]MCZ4550099.1 hypothetical protein [Gordonia rubripertincta]